MHHTSHITHHLPSIIQYLSSTTHHAASRISLHQHQHQHPHHPSALSPHPSALRPQASGLKPQASGLMIMIMTMIMIMNMIMIMIMTMVSYHHYEPPRAVSGSVVVTSKFCRTFSQIASPTPFVWTRGMNFSQQLNKFLYFEIIHVSEQLRSNQITIIYDVSSFMYH